jgi:PPOX class probable FMN-dependent enzyme
MTSIDPHRLTTVEQVRAIVGEESPVTRTKIFPTLDPTAVDFIAHAPILLLATADADGRPEVSPKGDGPGFVLVDDERTLLIPDRKGNRLIFGLQNILANPVVGLIFLVPGTEETLRVQGRAELTADPSVLERLSARGQPAMLAIRVHVAQAFFHCAKAFKRSSLWNPDTWPPNRRVSFGKMLAPKLGGDDALAATIDQMIEEDYKTNL